EDVRMRSMGSLLTCVAMVASAHGLLVKFPVAGTGDGYLPTPDYIHAYLRAKGGYRAGPAKTVIIDYHGLTRAFFAPPVVPAGLDFEANTWPAARFDFDVDLTAGLPSILYIREADTRFHPVVAVGWDPDTSSYWVLDPA